MTRARACALPAQSALHAHRRPGEFLDCYVIEAEATPREAALIITSFPGWARGLLDIRRIVTAPFGLRNHPPPGVDCVGPFPVVSEDETEMLAGFDDRHLNFLVSVFCKDGLVHLATWVDPHNIGGRLYLGAILPFHVLIARNALQRVAATR